MVLLTDDMHPQGLWLSNHTDRKQTDHENSVRFNYLSVHMDGT